MGYVRPAAWRRSTMIFKRNSGVFSQKVRTKPGGTEGRNMKRKWIMAIAFIFIMVHFAAFGKTVISDEELEGVTAEEGVSVDLTQLTVRTTAVLGTTSWGDGDGYGSTYTSAGFMGVTGTAMSGNFATFGGSANIDVGTQAGQTSLILQMPTVTLGAMNAETTMKLGTGMSLSGTQEMGRLNTQGYTTVITAERIQISAH